MKRYLAAGLLWVCFQAQQLWAEENPFVTREDVTWTAPGKNENDSMPIGNGDLAANVWTETNGDLVLLVAKSDAWTEMGKLVKLGRVRVRLEPNPFVDAKDFKQTLHLENGTVEIKCGANVLLVWADANRPAIHVEASLARPTELNATLELWRTNTHSYNTRSPDKGGMFEFGGHTVPMDFEADTIFPAEGKEIAWCHFNTGSIYPLVMAQEHLGEVATKFADPLLHRCFGAMLTGPNLAANGINTLKSTEPTKHLRLDLIALTETNVESIETWRKDVKSFANESTGVDLAETRIAHDKWWRDFWDRSWMHVGGTEAAGKVSQGYAMQRYMMASSSRGAFPVKFNGGLFTVGRDLPENQESTDRNHNADFRAWGNSYWNQNNRLPYWPLLATGDFDLLKPWFGMYLNALPMAVDRTRLYYHHDGASLPETMLFWGVPNLNDFGWDNKGHEIESGWQRYHIQGAMEIIAQMLDEYDMTQDADFARRNIVPFADQIVTFYGAHWPRTADGKIRMTPMQSLETYQLDAINPTPDIAGLKSILPRMLALPEDVSTAEQRSKWGEVFRDLPPIPMGKTAHGKLADFGKGDSDGAAIILPAEQYGKTCNSENPELYVAFPYRLYGVGKPDLTLARATYAARRFPQNTCWGQDGPQAAVLGLTDEGQKAALAEFTDYGDQRFRWFWKAGHDWIPDFDNGGTGMMTLQLMLMQCDGKRIQLLPAWPKEWTADFKLHAPLQTTVEGHVENGKVTNLKVTPETRASDVIVVSGE